MSRTPVTDWQQLSALYEQADALDPAALADWLVQLRLLRHPLLPQLEQMLEARLQLRANESTSTSTYFSAAPKPHDDDWEPGSRVGAYRMLRKIGTGGMADVWLAERDDGAFRRQVAIKLLFRHAGSRERDAFARRFDRERDILASLNHPNIAGLHDAGVTPAGQAWLALEYVEGDTLTDWCDAHRLDLVERVRLYAQVLLAVQHAHANLVIHRDLKPGNILVNKQGEVRLLDFGIAKLMETEGGGALAETELTRLAGRPMTPQYASPEQITGQALTTASDVYALGAVLYELLCGERPYELKIASTAQLEQAILETDPRPMSRRAISDESATARGTTAKALSRELANDLDAIVLRALAKKPRRRYASAESLAADLDRWLQGRPVEARGPSRFYRARKFVRRHRWGVALAAGMVAVLMVATVAAVVAGARAREDSAQAVAARDFMLNMFRLADKEKSQGADITARELLETGRKDVLTRLPGQPRLQAELLRGIGKIQGDMGEFEAADSTFADLAVTLGELKRYREQALAEVDRAWNALAMNRPDLADRLLREVDNAPARKLNDPELNAALAQVGGTLEITRGHAEQARASLLAARDAAVGALGPDHPRTFLLGQALVRADKDTGKIDDALKLQDELRHAARHLPGVGADVYAEMDLDQTNILYSAGKFQDALRLADEVLPQCVAALGPQAQPCRYLEVQHAQLLQKLGWTDLAAQALPRIRINGDDANLPLLQIQSLLFELRLHISPASAADAAERERAFRRVQDFAETASAQASLRAGAMLGLAECRLRMNDPEQAKRWTRQALALMHDVGEQPASSRTGANARMLTGLALLEEGRGAEATPWLQRALSYATSSLGPNHVNVQVMAMNMALANESIGDTAEALAIAERAQIPIATAYGADSPVTRRAGQTLARLRTELAFNDQSSRPRQPGAMMNDYANEFFSAQ